MPADTAEAARTSARERQQGDYSPPILVQPQGGPVPTAAADAAPTAKPKDAPKAATEPAVQMELPLSVDDSHDALRVAKELAAAVDGLSAWWPTLAGQLVAALVADSADTTADDLSGVALLAASPAGVAAISAELGDAMSGLAAVASSSATEEIAALGVAAPAGSVDPTALQGRATVVADLIGRTLASSAIRASLQYAGLDGAEAVAAVRAELDDLIALKPGGYLLQNLESALAAAQAAGRMAAFREAEDEIQLAANESNETASRCQACADMDGRVFDTFAEAAAAYPAGRLMTCAGRGRCHGHLQPVLRTS